MGGPSIPRMPAPPAAPTPIDQAILEARRRERQKQIAQGGRGSTILTSPQGAKGSPTLGTPSLLGGA